MSWSAEFITELGRQSQAPVWIVEAIPAGDTPIGTPIKFASAPGIGDYPLLGLQGVKVQGQTLSRTSWTTTIGTFSVEIVGSATALFRNITRGTFLLVKQGYAGWAENQFQTVAIGQVHNIKGVFPSWSIECRDLFAALRSRLGQINSIELFNSLGGSSLLTVDYTAGLGTLTVASTATFTAEAGGDGAVRVVPSSGDAFYVRYTGKTATTLTGCTANFGTLDVDAAIGSVVEDAALLSGHPMDVVRRLLTSSSGTGEYDDYDDTWGIGLPSDLIDHEDMDLWRDALHVTSGTWDWDIVVTGPEPDGLGFISSILASCGMFLAIRQGKLAVRVGTSMSGSTYAFHTGLTITDGDIAEVLEWEAFDADSPIEYAQVSVTTRSNVNGEDEVNSGTVESPPATLPAAKTKNFDLSGLVWNNRLRVKTDMIERMAESVLRIPERLVLRLVPLHWAQLTVGDPVSLNTKRIYGRYDADGYVDRSAIVVQVSPDYVEGFVDVALVLYPDTAEAFV